MTDATVTIMVSAVRREMEETRETMVTDHSARNGDRNGRNDGQRPYQNNGRPGQGQGDRNNNRNNGFRGGNNGGGRLDREIDRFNKEAAAAPEELRGKESRERDKDRNKNARQRNDYDALGGKKQERFINLEKNGGKKKPSAAAKTAAGRGCDPHTGITGETYDQRVS